MTMQSPHQTDASPRLAVGCMTGTSIDGLDIALIQAQGHGLSLRARVVEHAQRPLGALGPELRALSQGESFSAMRVCDLAHHFGLLHARSIADLLGPRRAELVALHGQTVFHRPPLSWQLINPFPVAAALGCPVVYDLRQSDLCAGGQGAPITPIADWVLLRGPGARAIVNLGGFCNLTRLPPAPDGSAADDPGALAAIGGKDVCACNHVLDGVARAVLGAPFDEDGRAAASGTPRDEAVAALTSALGAQAASGRSLGSGDETHQWIERWKDVLLPHDLAASAVQGVARQIAAAIEPGDRVFAAGGGAKNTALLRAIESLAAAPVGTTSALGLPVDAREAAEIAVLGLLCQDRVGITLPQVTGRHAACTVSGAWVLP